MPIAIPIAAGIGAAGLGAGVAGGLASSQVKAPRRRDYGYELGSTLGTQQDLAGQLYGAEASQEYGQPAYARLSAENMGILGGGAAGLLAQLAPGLAGTYGGLNPAYTALLGQLTGDASAGLAAGANLMPTDVNRITQMTRGDWAARGLGTSAPAQLDEALRLAGAGETLRQGRQNFASNVAGMNYQSMQPLYDILSRLGTGQLGQGYLANAGSVFNPESQYAGDIYSQDYQARAAARAATAANKAAAWGSLAGAGGQLLGAAFSK